MKRRHFLLAAGATGIASPARSQLPSGPRIAYLSGRSAATDAHLLEAFREGFKSAGFVDGQNVTMDIRWANGRYGDVAKMAAEVAATKPDLIVAVGGNPVAVAAKQATSTIPVVFGAGADPVKIGLVDNLNRPGGNLTGMTLWANELDAKRLDLLHDMLPKARTVAVLMNPDNPGYEDLLPRTRETAAALGLEIKLLTAAGSSAIERAFESLPAGSVDALAVGADAFLINSRARIVALTNERHLPAIFPAREFAIDGGLASYGTRWTDMYRILGSYAGRILKGAKPAELPVQRPTTYELVLNLKTARTLGLDLPPLILTRADEVIE
ncbi:putative ABC transport system substrate-binding protein [Rhodospirillales bacterium URHD0017]|nr:putative ABC transport system substrate-binding protein [Rhodospirillales bacterium URHD0017]